MSFSLSEKDLERWQRAGAAFSDEILISETRDNNPVAGDESERDLPTPSSQRYRSFEACFLPQDVSRKDWYQTAGYLDLRRVNAMWDVSMNTAYKGIPVLWLLGSFYGGVHLSLWTYNFPSRTECLLWRSSAVALGALPALVMLIGSFVYCVNILNDYVRNQSCRRSLGCPSFVSRVTNSLRGTLDNVLHGAANKERFSSDRTDLINVKTPSCLTRTIAWLQDIWIKFLGYVSYTCVKASSFIFYIEVNLFIIVCVVAAAAALLYTLARVFIVVESFISLRHVATGVYSGVTWAQYIPHL